MSGRLAVVGLGPGDARWLTPEADAALGDAEALYGYAPYLDRVPERPTQTRHPSDNREEAARAAAALAEAATGRNVALVSGGDPGVFAMAAAVCEAIERGPQAWRTLGIEVMLLRRPALPVVASVETIAEAVAWLDHAPASVADRGV